MNRILCVEDEPALRQVIVEELSLAGYETLEAGNGMEGLSIILDHQPDLVLCDVTMPQMDGHDLLRTLRIDHPEHAELPFIFLSALAEKTNIIEGRKLGADDYLTKPVDLDILLTTVESRLEQVQRVRELKQSEMDSLRTQIIHTLPHEFRTPLNAVIGYAEMIHGEMLGPIGNDQYKEYADQILQGGRRLHYTVEKLLAVSELTCGRAIVEDMPFDLVEAVEGVVFDMKKRYSTSPCEVELSSTRPYMNVALGHAYMEQALREVVDNAFKFSPKGGVIKVHLDATNRMAKVIVEDHGEGMSSEVVKKLTSAFVQAETGHTRSYEGLGLGLSLAEKALEVIGGTIQFESSPGEGTRVTIYAPLRDDSTLDILLS